MSYEQAEAEAERERAEKERAARLAEQRQVSISVLVDTRLNIDENGTHAHSARLKRSMNTEKNSRFECVGCIVPPRHQHTCIRMRILTHFFTYTQQKNESSGQKVPQNSRRVQNPTEELSSTYPVLFSKEGKCLVVWVLVTRSKHFLQQLAATRLDYTDCNS